MLEEIENFFSLKQKEIGKVTEYRELKDRIFLMEYQEKELYIFIEKVPEDSIKISIVEFYFENKEKGTVQTSKLYSVTRKFSEFKQESIFSVYHSIDEILKILYELISNGKFIIYDETLDLANFNSTHNSSQINKESYIYINDLNENNTRNKINNNKGKNEFRFSEAYDSPESKFVSKRVNKENKSENSKINNEEKEIKNFSPFKIFNNNKTNNISHSKSTNNNNNIKIFFRLALLNRILISNIELEYKETSLNKAFESNNKNNGITSSPESSFDNIQKNNLFFLTYVMNIMRILRNRTFEKNAVLGKNIEKDRLSVNTIRLGNETYSSNKNSIFLKEKMKYEDSDGEEIDKFHYKKNESIFMNTNTENASNPSSPLKNLLISKNIRNKGTSQEMLSNDVKNHEMFRKSIFNGETNQFNVDKSQNNTNNNILSLMLNRNGGNSQIESKDLSNYSINDKMEYYRERATYLNSLLKYSLKWNNLCSSDEDIAKYSQLHLVLDLVNNLTIASQKSIIDSTDKNFILYDIESRKQGNIFYKNGLIFDGEIQNGKEHGYGLYYKINIQKIYEGEFKEGKFNGKGSFYSKSGIIHEGTYQDGFHVFKLIKSLNPSHNHSNNSPFSKTNNIKNDNYNNILNQSQKFNGLDSIPPPNSNKELNSPVEQKKLYECEYKINRFTLHGTMNALLNSTYIGYFDDENRFSGKGHKKWENGESYEGDFKEDTRHGYGVLRFQNGDIFQGEFKENLKWGKGTFLWANGNRYEGNWKEGKPHGFGKKFWKNGNKFEGFWKEGKQHGTGLKTWANGDKYEGEYKEGKQHGKGTYTWADGDKYEGEWRFGLQHGSGCYSWSNGKKYIGEYKEDLKHGKGSLILGGGERYDGEFKDNVMHGYGVYVYKDGFIYEGQFKDNMEHGFGTLKDEKGNIVYKGLFENGKRKIKDLDEDGENANDDIGVKKEEEEEDQVKIKKDEEERETNNKENNNNEDSKENHNE